MRGNPKRRQGRDINRRSKRISESPCQFLHRNRQEPRDLPDQKGELAAAKHHKRRNVNHKVVSRHSRYQVKSRHKDPRLGGTQRRFFGAT